MEHGTEGVYRGPIYFVGTNEGKRIEYLDQPIPELNDKRVPLLFVDVELARQVAHDDGRGYRVLQHAENLYGAESFREHAKQGFTHVGLCDFNGTRPIPINYIISLYERRGEADFGTLLDDARNRPKPSRFWPECN
jgi:hypothetical protein